MRKRPKADNKDTKQGKPKKQTHSPSILPKTQTKKSETGSSPPIVGIGASAGGLEALSMLFSSLTAETGMAFVLVQHLNPQSTSSLADILSRQTSMPVQNISDGLVANPNHVYVMPPNASLTVQNQKFRLGPRIDSRGHPHLPIDSFFMSLAESEGPNAIGIVLSGLGADGAIGLRAINAHHGVTFAQLPNTAKFPSMPSQAISTGCIDFILSPKKIALELEHLSKHPLMRTEAQAEKSAVTGEDQDLENILEILTTQQGIDFSGYKSNTIKRRIDRRMILNRQATITGYIKLLQSDKEELDALRDDLLIKVTRFFRDPEVFEALSKSIFPKIIEKDENESNIRIWVPACSTGEEPYSLAIALLEILPEEKRRNIQIFATDLSEQAVTRARTGKYGNEIESTVSPKRLKTFFEKVDSGYQIKRNIRGLCTFAVQNIVTDTPFSRLDFVSCRNLMIYLGPTVQKNVLSTLHYSLKPDGFLLLGTAENINGHHELFEVFDRKHSIFSKKASKPISFFQPPTEIYQKNMFKGNPARLTKLNHDENSIFQEADRLISTKLSPAGFVINEEMDILQVRGNTTHYCSLSPGIPTYSLFKVVKNELILPLRTLLQRVKNTGLGCAEDNIILPLEEKSVSITAQIHPILLKSNSPKHYVIVLTEKFAPKNLRSTPDPTTVSPADPKEADSLRELEYDLIEMREHMRVIIEEYGTTNEELKSSNEELMSHSEEIQSTNEELQTAKEEIQSSNEELTTLNEELQSRNDQLRITSDDMLNLLRSTGIPFLMLDTKLKIRRFTPEITHLFKIIQSDVGRPISDMRQNFVYKPFLELVSNTNETGKHAQVEVRNKEGRHYWMRVRPYVSIGNQIQGVLLSFLDFTENRAAQKRIAQSEQRFRGIFERSPIGILTEFEGKITGANDACRKLLGYSNEELLGKSIDDLTYPKDLSKIHSAIQGLTEGDTNASQVEKRYLRKDGSLIWSSVTTTVIRDSTEKICGTNTMIVDITDRIKERERLALEKEAADSSNKQKSSFLAHMSHEIRTPLTSILGFSEMLANHASTDAERKDYTNRIRASGQHLRDLIDDILDLSKVESGKIDIEEVSFSLRDLIENCMKTLAPLAKKRRNRSTLKWEGVAPESVISDPTRIKQIFLNIVGNALKFTKDGSVEVIVNPLEAVNGETDLHRLLRIQVKDTGCGIAPDRHTELFRPFTQADSSMNRKYGGTGLGLVLSKKLAEAMGGDIQICSSTPGKGSVFEISILLSTEEGEPKSKEEVASDTESAPAKALGYKLMRVLIVEDHPNLQKLAGDMLKRLGINPEFASDGETALTMAHKTEYDLILMDIQLPNLNGYEATKRLRESGYTKPIVALTARLMQSDMIKSRKAGCNENIAKPYSFADLVELLDKYSVKPSA